MEALRTSVESAEAEVRNLADQTSGLERDAKQALRLRTKISEDRRACHVLEDHYGVVGRLAQVADGSNAQSTFTDSTFFPGFKCFVRS